MERIVKILQRRWRVKKQMKDVLSFPLVKEWICGGPDFLEAKKLSSHKDGKKYNDWEKRWAHLVLQRYLDYSKHTNQWSTAFSELLFKRILEQSGKIVWRPNPCGGLCPDWETDDAIYEIKARNYTTSGTAGEKILGTPFKYSKVPKLYGKPLYIVVMGYQEVEAVENFKLFGGYTEEQNQIIELWKTMRIKFVRCSDILKEILPN